MATMNIDILLKKYKLNQKDLAESTGINENTISRYCTGNFKKLDKIHIDLICKYFKCTPNDLFEIDDSVEVEPAKVLYYDDETNDFSYGEIAHAMISPLTWIGSKIVRGMTEQTQPDIQTIDSNGKITSYEIKTSTSPKNRKFHGSREALKIMESLEKEHPNSILSEEDIIEMDEMQYKLDLEYEIETNLYQVIIWAVNDADSNVYTNEFKCEIINYLESKNLSFSVKLTTMYRVIYKLLKLDHHLGILGFLTKLRNIYSNGDLLSLTIDELEDIKSQSQFFLNSINKPVINTNKKD